LNNDVKKQLEHLDKAIAADPQDADVLIAMYRVTMASDEYRERTRERIRRTAADFYKEAEEFGRQMDEANEEEIRQYLSIRLASLYNQYAWLVGNTEGDYDMALRYSHKSLELRPGTAGYLDTLGRCYFAKGDYVSAVRFQAQAAKRDPHNGAISRQLELFQRTLAKEREKKSAEAPPQP
jgi:tetratricopeptide (TPR) repeat protein